jgi:hypothetical protein
MYLFVYLIEGSLLYDTEEEQHLPVSSSLSWVLLGWTDTNSSKFITNTSSKLNVFMFQI